jgi:hypothetical protein
MPHAQPLKNVHTQGADMICDAWRALKDCGKIMETGVIRARLDSAQCSVRSETSLEGIVKKIEYIIKDL